MRKSFVNCIKCLANYKRSVIEFKSRMVLMNYEKKKFNNGNNIADEYRLYGNMRDYCIFFLQTYT